VAADPFLVRGSPRRGYDGRHGSSEVATTVTDGRPGPPAAGRDRALDALVAVAARLAAADRLVPVTPEPALDAVAEAAADFIGVTAASVALHDRATDRLVFRAAAGPEGRGVIGLSIAPHEGIAGYVFSTGQPLAVTDVTVDPRFERATAEQTGYVPRSVLAVPLVDGVDAIGVFELLDRRDGAPFDLTDIEAATRMAAAMTAVARTSRVDREAEGLLRTVLASIAEGDGEGAGLDRDAIEVLVTAVIERSTADDPVWRLADRIARLRTADPDDIELAVEWLDALLARTERRAEAGRRRLV
jgi:signal transduction protein with GAF and PtsI domain